MFNKSNSGLNSTCTITPTGPVTSAAISWHERPDGGRVRLWHWAAAGPSRRGSMLVLACYMEYGAYHDIYAAPLAQEGFDVYVMDLRGYGSLHGHEPITSAEPLLQDAMFMLDYLGESSGERPVLLGYASGGLIALEMCRTATLQSRALVLVSPCIAVLHTSPRFDLGFQLLVRQHPDVMVPYPTPDPLNNQPGRLKVWREDPQVNLTCTAGELFAHLDLQRRVRHSVVAPKVPVLVIEGEADRISDTTVSAKYWSRMRKAGVKLEHHFVTGSNLAVHSDAPEDFFRHLRDFLIKLPPQVSVASSPVEEIKS